MKKLTCILVVIFFSLTTFAKGGHVMGRKYTPSLDNNQIAKSQQEQRSNLRSFSGRKYASVTRRAFHPFARRSRGASRPESGLGL